MRWTLSRKIFGLVLLNLLLICAAVLAFVLFQFRGGPGAWLLGASGDRIAAITNSVRLELETTPPEQWPGLLDSYSRRYQAEFYLINPQGIFLTSRTIELPAQLLARLHDGRRNDRPPPPPPGENPRPEDDRPPPPRPDDRPREASFFVITRSPTLYWEGVRMPVPGSEGWRNTPGILLVRSDSILRGGLFFNWIPWVGLPFVLALISGLCWLPFIRGLTHSIAQMDRATAQIAQGRFDRLAVVKRQDELGHLGSQIDALSSRLASFVNHQKRFPGDIAHELCAPIARIQFALGILEQRSEEAQHSHIAQLREEIQEMSALVNELLSFSRAGLDAGAASLASLNVHAVAQKAAAREGLTQVSVAVAPDLRALANEGSLVRALSNILRNAARYAGDGPIVVSARQERGEVVVSIADSGPGLPENELEEVFEPFYRAESSRNRESGGVGLGLAIVKSCVLACGGTVSCRNRQPSGLEVTIRLQAA